MSVPVFITAEYTDAPEPGVILYVLGEQVMTLRPCPRAGAEPGAADEIAKQAIRELVGHALYTLGHRGAFRG